MARPNYQALAPAFRPSPPCLCPHWPWWRCPVANTQFQVFPLYSLAAWELQATVIWPGGCLTPTTRVSTSSLFPPLKILFQQIHNLVLQNDEFIPQWEKFLLDFCISWLLHQVQFSYINIDTYFAVKTFEFLLSPKKTVVSISSC